MIRRLVGLLAAALWALTLLPTASQAQDARTRVIRDTAGRDVVVPAEVKRIVIIRGACNVPSLVSLLGAGDRVISGLCFKRPGEDLQLKVQPGYASIGVIAPNEAGVDPEQLLNLRPDVVIVWNNVRNVDALTKLGIPVLVMDISSLEKVREVVVMLGQLTGTQARADEYLRELERVRADLDRRLQTLGTRPRATALVLSSAKPLTALGDVSHNSFMIRMSGGVPTTQGMPGHFVPISAEQLLKADPDYIILSPVVPTLLRDLATLDIWKELRAVKAGHVYAAPWGLFFWDKPGAEAPLFLLWQAHVFYPELVSYRELAAETDRFFQKYFGLALSPGDFQLIFGSKANGGLL